MSVQPNSVAEPGVLNEVPDKLKSLAKYIMRGFYTIEHALIVDLLVRNRIMREDDLADLLKFDKKHVRTLLIKLKTDKLLKQVMRVETQADGRTNRHYYYYINYKVFVNVVRFKLDRMRQKIEHRERDSTCKALFKCSQCERTYNEFDAGNLYDPMSMMMKCTYCGEEVQEDETAVPKRDAVTQMVTFNEQMKPIFDLLKDVENIKLSQEVLEPSPVPISENTRLSKGNKGINVGGQWRENARGIANLYTQDVTINIGDEGQSTGQDEAAPKERPIWMAESTVDGVSTEVAPSVGNSGVVSTTDEVTSRRGKSSDGEIMRALLAHERKAGQRPNFPGGGGGGVNSDNESDASASDDEFPTKSAPMMTEDIMAVGMVTGDSFQAVEEEDEEEEEVVAMVRGRPVALSDVTPDLIEQMTPIEKDEYIKLAQEAYADMYE